MNSFIFLPRLLSIEPGSGIIADRNHRERERKRQVYSCIFVRACRVFRISEWSRPAMPAGPRYSIYSAPIKNESKISLPPSLPPTLALANARSMHERPRICHELQRVLLSWLRARSPCQEQPCKADTTSSTSYEGTVILELPSGKITFSPPLERHGGGGERIFGKEREECVVFELRLRAKEVRKRGWATPRIFSFFFFFPLFERGANRVSTSVLVHAHAVTNGHDRYPYLNTGRKY